MKKKEIKEELIRNLLSQAEQALQNAYVPYSNYPVGAAMKTKDGETFTGCNVENASYGLTNCAERTAIFKAVSHGYRDIQVMAVVSNSERHASPCGACRQVISEFSDDAILILANKDGDYQIVKASELLPGAFTAQELE
ncbi:cytidine deaminase [Natranaerobius thermophilus]|uniref:Cytidine deaminase n=1 Tax=Natranaerobius thermophilus (strain ATCC BAA-1301 / DSM 18059 / JW/NM-WN-LF) TaxID=457570 RepID=B2A1Y1_NATTJ|nr:cytidine deaminase [Natranaerobius thermophilus]ACB84786.1 cytidine deaminase [Natranaerobius thermophilus JW/NM-WN-LF]